MRRSSTYESPRKSSKSSRSSRLRGSRVVEGVVGMDTGVMDGVIAAAVVGDVVVVEDAAAAIVVVARGGAGSLNDFLFFSFRPLG